jgi:ATP synthase mitochondrial F1 complex assembly factor 1
MKLDLVQDKTIDEIRAIWVEYHKSKEVLAATIPVAQYDLLMQRGREFPIFIFPLPRSQGYEFFISQFDRNHCIHFTSLLCYQVHKENAPECLSLIHYTELRDKGAILMRGEYDPKVLTAKEAQCLANQFQLYFAQHDADKLKLLEKFTKQPESFKHMDVIKELENLKIG